MGMGLSFTGWEEDYEHTFTYDMRYLTGLGHSFMEWEEDYAQRSADLTGAWCYVRRAGC